MKRNVLYSFAFIAILLISTSTAFTQSRGEYDIYQRVNRERSKFRLGTLAWDDRLAQLARDYSRKMAREGFFGHYDRSGLAVEDRAIAARIKNWSVIGENLFFCEDHPTYVDTAVTGWMKSPTHRENILDREFTTTGIGIATARDGSIFVTQVFTRN